MLQEGYKCRLFKNMIKNIKQHLQVISLLLKMCQVPLYVFHMDFHPQMTCYRRMKGTIIIVPTLQVKIPRNEGGNS